jgi:hypothetical protein
MGAGRRIDRSLGRRLCRFPPKVNDPLAIPVQRAMMALQEIST